MDVISIHVYSGVTDFAAADSYVSMMAEYGLTDIPIIYSEWNYDWTIGTPGSLKDTNLNAAYGAKRLFTAAAQDNVDYVFYFTPADALEPDQLMYGDSGIYTIDGHRKSAANMLAMYNDLESECLQSATNLKLNQNSVTYGLVTKNSDTERVAALLFNYSDKSNSLDIAISNLPYSSNVKITTKIIDENSGNYYKDYAAGIRGYSETPNERPDTYTEVRNGFTEYNETIEMTPYSVMEIVLEPTEDALQERTLEEKASPAINLSRDMSVTTNSEDNSVIKNAKEQDLLWGSDKLTDGYTLTIDLVDMGTTNMGYRSESFDTPDNNVWVTADLGESQSINTVKLYPLNDKVHGGKGVPVDYTIEVSEDGENWTAVYSETGFDNNGSHSAKTILFPTTNARYVRLNVSKLSEETDGYRLQLAEIEVYNSDDISILDGISCITDGKTITTSEDVMVIQAFYNDNVLTNVKLDKGRHFDIDNTYDKAVIFVYVWTDTLQPVTNTIRIK